MNKEIEKYLESIDFEVEVFDEIDIDLEKFYPTQLNVLPCVDKVVSILCRHQFYPIKATEKWIVTADIDCNIWEELEDADLVPWSGYYYKYSDFVNK